MHGITNLIIVSHGITLRAFTMMWFVSVTLLCASPSETYSRMVWRGTQPRELLHSTVWWLRRQGLYLAWNMRTQQTRRRLSHTHTRIESGKANVNKPKTHFSFVRWVAMKQLERKCSAQSKSYWKTLTMAEPQWSISSEMGAKSIYTMSCTIFYTLLLSSSHIQQRRYH